MPIDLKWVRSDPDQVREWQSLRRRRVVAAPKGGGSVDDNDVPGMDLVEDALQKDELSRKNLQTLQEHKKCLKQMQVRLRPKKTKNDGRSEKNAIDQQDNPEDSRENLMKEKKGIEPKIRLAEAAWKASLEDTHKALRKLASPVTIMMDGDGVYDLDATQVAVTPCSLPFFDYTSTSLGMNLEQAWRQYTLRYFAEYLWVEMPRGIPVVEFPSDLSRPLDFASITQDRAHELWGCFSPAPSPANHLVAILPSWIRLLTEFLPNKSIWGEKELPRYTAIWSRREMNHPLLQGSENALWLGDKQYNRANTGEQHASVSSLSKQSSLELVAVMAPSLVDAREIQNKFVQELLSYYGGLLMVDESSPKNLKRIFVPAPDLHNHERSRIEIHLVMSSDCGECGGKISTLRLGWVSHWGDAATRACDMAFAGGGVVQAGGKKKYGTASRNASTKEYVHLVEASVIDDFSSTWKKILHANSNAAVNSRNGTDLSVNVPPVLAPHLVRPIPDLSKVVLKDLFFDEKRKRKKKESIFGVLADKKNSALGQTKQQEPVNSCYSIGVETNAVENSATRNQPKFPPFGVASSMSQGELHQKRIRLEKLSCPYDFLFE